MNKLSLGQGRKVTVVAMAPAIAAEAAKTAVPEQDLAPALGGANHREPAVAPPSAETLEQVAAGLPKGRLDPELITLAGVSQGPPVFNTYPFETLRTSQRVYLVPDPYGAVVKPETGHPDPYAISVQDAPPESGKGRHIGYIPAKMAQVITCWLAEPDNAHCQLHASIARIKGGYETEGGKRLSFGVDIMVVFEDV